MPIALSPRVPHVIALSATLGLLATVGWASHQSAQIVAEQPLPVALDEAAMPVKITEAVAVRQPAPPRAPSNQLLFVFRIGNDSYLKLSDDEPKHGTRVLVDDASTVTDVAVANLPARFRGWETKAFEVDGGCVATVKGFAVVTRAMGTPAYAGLDDETWTTETAAKAGTSQLAARLELDGCETALYARDASLAPIVELAAIERPDLVDQATSALMTTAAAEEAQAEWVRAGADSPDYGKGSWLEHSTVNAMVRRHPTTGQIFVGLHAAIREGCGGPDINVWSMFRVGRNGTLVMMHAERISSLYSIDRMLDVDNDGDIELLGQDWLGLTNVLATAKGEQYDQLALAFHGCAC